MRLHTTYPVDTEKTIRRVNKYIKYVKENVRIGTVVIVKPERSDKGQCCLLELCDVQGQHFIFKSQSGWIQSYSMSQLCFDLANGNLIIKEKENGENDKNRNNR